MKKGYIIKIIEDYSYLSCSQEMTIQMFGYISIRRTTKPYPIKWGLATWSNYAI